MSPNNHEDNVNENQEVNSDEVSTQSAPDDLALETVEAEHVEVHEEREFEVRQEHSEGDVESKENVGVEVGDVAEAPMPRLGASLPRTNDSLPKKIKRDKASARKQLAIDQTTQSSVAKSRGASPKKTPKRNVGATLWSTFTALTAVAAFGALAVGGAQGIKANEEVKATGTEITVAAPAVSLVCPNPIFAVQGAGADLGVEELEDGAVKSTHDVTAALVGGAGSVSFSSLGLPKDSTTGETPVSAPVQIADVPGPGGTTGKEALGKVLLQDAVESSLVVTTNKRAVSNAQAPELTAASIFNAHSGGDSRGLSAANCAAAAGEHWLVGGSTSVGNSTKLVISNPSITPATVKITLWGPSGRIELAGSDTYLVSAGSQLSTLLEGVAAEQRRLAVHVEAEGAQVSAYLEQSALDGLTAYGSDYVMSGAGPSRAQVLSGIDVANVPVDSEAAAAIRVVVPDFSPALSLAEQSEEAAGDIETEVIGHARIRLLGQDGNIVMFGAEEVELSPGVVQDISLGGAPTGVYSVIIESDVPLIAGAISVKEGPSPTSGPLGTPRDFSWVNASAVYSNEQYSSRVGFERWASGEVQLSDEVVASSSDGLVAIPAGVDATLSLVGLPRATHVDGLVESLNLIPNVYSALAGSDASAEETDAAEVAAQQWKPVTVAQVVAYGADGSVLGTKEVALADGQSSALGLSQFGAVAAISVISTDGGVVDWSIVLGSSAINGSTARLSVAVIEQEPTDLWVSRSTQLN